LPEFGINVVRSLELDLEVPTIAANASFPSLGIRASPDDEIAQTSPRICCQHKTEERQNQVQPAAAIMTANRYDASDEKHRTEDCTDKQEDILQAAPLGLPNAKFSSKRS